MRDWVSGQLHDRVWLALILSMAAGCWALPAQAQYYDGPAYSFPVMDMMGPAMAGTSMSSYINRQNPRRDDRDGTPPQPRASLQVPRDRALSQRVKAEFRADLVRINPGKEVAIDQALAQDWLAGYRTDIAVPNGLDPANLADAVTAYVIAGWAIVNRQEQISARGIARVRDNFRAAMAASPQTAGLSAAARQEMAERLIYQTVLIMANRVQIARTRDNQLAEAAARHYRETLRSGTGIDLANLKLEDSGFIAR